MEESPPVRVIFTFDKVSYSQLERLGESLGFRSKAETVRAALRLAYSLKDQVEKGFSEVVVRNPTTRAERILVIDFLEKLARVSSVS